MAFVPIDEMQRRFRAVHVACEAAGRDPATIVWSVSLVLCCGESEDVVIRRAQAIRREVAELRENGLAGLPADVLAKLAAYAEAGAQRFYLQVLDLDDLDHLRLVAEEVMPQLP